MEKSALHLTVEGRVQGVGFRHWTVSLGRSLGLNGWAKNRPDGSVEIHAEGDAAHLAEFAARVEQGPETARVTRCTATRSVPQNYKVFSVEY